MRLISLIKLERFQAGMKISLIGGMVVVFDMETRLLLMSCSMSSRQDLVLGDSIKRRAVLGSLGDNLRTF